VDLDFLKSKPEVRALVDQLARYYDEQSDEPEPRVWGYLDEEAEAIHRLARRKAAEPFHEEAFVRKMTDLRPLVAQPKLDGSPLECWQILAQPEIAEWLWAEWPSRPGSRGPDPGIMGKSMLFGTALFGFSPHLKANHLLLSESDRRRAVFEHIEQTAAASGGKRPAHWGGKSYARAVEQMHASAKTLFEDDAELADTVYIPDTIFEVNIALNRFVLERLGVSTIDLALDGMAVKGWCAQESTRPADREAGIRRVARNAGPRSLGDRHKFWRGYYLFTLVVLQTGLPLIWILVDAGTDEFTALQQLLATLFRLWPNVRVRHLVADAAWDESPSVEWALRRFGIALIARRTHVRQQTRHPLNKFDYEHVSAFRGDGAAWCREHGCLLIRDGAEGLTLRLSSPGVARPVNQFRIRQRCPEGGPECGRSQVLMKENWAALSPLPHSQEVGQPKHHAHRLALFSRRNSIETLFSAIQISNKLGLFGSARTRTAKEPTVAALFSLCLTLRSATMSADLRIREGDFPEMPPPDLASKLLR
jgi:hypothetical protein